MKQGMLWVYTLSLLFAGYTTAGGDNVHDTRVPTLENRVDELNLNIGARDSTLDDQWKALTRLTTESRKLAIERTQSQEQLVAMAKTHKETSALRKNTTVTLPHGVESSFMVNNRFEVTWYNDYGYTKSGRFVKDGVTVAVDPRVIKLGSWLLLQFPDGRRMIRRADDTGGAVKGHVIDVYARASRSVLLRRGRVHGVRVTILRNHR